VAELTRYIIKEPLTDKELKVLDLLKEGVADRQEIAMSLQISYLKAEVCVRRVIKYFDASCVTDAGGN